MKLLGLLLLVGICSSDRTYCYALRHDGIHTAGHTLFLEMSPSAARAYREKDWQVLRVERVSC